VLTLVVTLLDVPIVRQLVWALIHIGGALLAFRSSVLGACSATKAAMHAFSMPLRHQFKRVRIRVIEIVPPAVDTERDEIAYGTSATMLNASRAELNAAFERMNSRW